MTATIGGNVKRAELIKILEGFAGNASLYKLTPALNVKPDYKGDFGGKVEFVVVSTAFALFTGVETYIFPATELGVISDWGALEGSQRGTSNHEKALNDAGYELAK